MPSLKVLYLQGNEVVRHIRQYRKTVIYRCCQLKYLDDRPVFPEERRRVDAWGRAWEATGNQEAAQEAERIEMEKIRLEKKQQEEMNFRFFEEMFLNGQQKHSNDSMKHEEPGPEIDDTCLRTQDAMSDLQSKGDTKKSHKEEVDPINPLRQERLNVLHQCATVGLDTTSDYKEFANQAFDIEQSAHPPAMTNENFFSHPPETKVALQSEFHVDANRQFLPPGPVTCTHIEERRTIQKRFPEPSS